MAEERHTTAFVVGAILGGIAGAGSTLWRVPRSGAQTRALLAERIEGALLRLTGMDAWQQSDITTQAKPVLASPLDEAMLQMTPEMVSEDATALLRDRVSADSETTDDGATLPLTFRGEVLVEGPAEPKVGAHTAESDR